MCIIVCHLIHEIFTFGTVWSNLLLLQLSGVEFEIVLNFPQDIKVNWCIINIFTEHIQLLCFKYFLNLSWLFTKDHFLKTEQQLCLLCSNCLKDHAVEMF